MLGEVRSAQSEDVDRLDRLDRLDNVPRVADRLLPRTTKFTPLAGSRDSGRPGSDSPAGPGSNAPTTGSRAPNAHKSSPDVGELDSSGGIDMSGTPVDTNDDDQPDTTIQQLPIDAEPLRQQIDRQ